MLRVEGLTAGYGDARVLQGVAFEAEKGAMTCILGPNGAGKTTLLRTIAGLMGPISGRVLFCGEEIQGRKTHDIVKLGMTMIPEGRRLWPPLTVEETLEMGAYMVRERGKVEEQMARVFGLFPHLTSRKGQLCGTLSGGEQQMVAIGRGLMGLPRLLLMDEPSLGLAPLIVSEMFRAIERIVEAGTTILLVEQNTQVALHVAKYGYVLETGAIVLDGDAASLRENPHIREAYLGL